MGRLKIGIITCSDTRTEADDTAGAALIALVEARDWEPHVVFVDPENRMVEMRSERLPD